MSDNTMRKVDIIERDEKLSGDSVGKIAVIEDCVEQMQREWARNMMWLWT